MTGYEMEAHRAKVQQAAALAQLAAAMERIAAAVEGLAVEAARANDRESDWPPREPT